MLMVMMVLFLFSRLRFQTDMTRIIMGYFAEKICHLLLAGMPHDAVPDNVSAYLCYEIGYDLCL